MLRAYRVIKIKYEKVPSFNLADHDKLFNFFLSHEDSLDNLNLSGGGEIEVTADTIREAIEKAEELELPKEVIEALKKDLDSLPNEDTDDYIMYSIF